MLAAAIVIALLFPVRVANRCAGEAGWPSGVHLCACTVRERLAHGWGEDNVLTAYYAPDQEAGPALIVQAQRGLAGADCPTDAYYLFEQESIDALRLAMSCATGSASSPAGGSASSPAGGSASSPAGGSASSPAGKSVWSFKRSTLKDLQCRRSAE